MTSAIDNDLFVRVDDTKTLWLTEVSRQTFSEQGVESLESDDGLFVVLEDITRGSFDILAKAASPVTGAVLLGLLAASLRPKPI